MRIGHIINIYDGSDDDTMRQGISIHAMEVARDVACFNGIYPKFGACYYMEDNIRPPMYWSRKILERSTEDYNMDKKLPFIHEIFQTFHKLDKCDVLVYTNSDIILSPYFYTQVPHFLRNRDAATILRNDITDKALIKHKGYDCFVFRSSLLEKIKLPRNVFIGYPPVGNVIFNALGDASNMNVCVIPSRDRMTSHIGNAAQWMNHPYVNINKLYAEETLDLL